MEQFACEPFLKIYIFSKNKWATVPQAREGGHGAAFGFFMGFVDNKKNTE